MAGINTDAPDDSLTRRPEAHCPRPKSHGIPKKFLHFFGRAKSDFPSRNKRSEFAGANPVNTPAHKRDSSSRLLGETPGLEHAIRHFTPLQKTLSCKILLPDNGADSGLRPSRLPGKRTNQPGRKTERFQRPHADLRSIVPNAQSLCLSDIKFGCAKKTNQTFPLVNFGTQM